MRNSRRLSWEFLENREMLSGLPTDYVTVGRWANPHLTYSIAPDGTSWNGTVSTLNADLTREVGADWQSAIVRAFSLWTGVANVSATQVGDGGEPEGTGGASQGDPRFGDIRIGGYANPTTNILASTYFPANGGGTLGGDLTVNTAGAYGSGIDFASVLAHELGHAFGLGHASNPGDVMFPVYQGVVSSLGEGDVAGVRSLYGAAPTAALTLIPTPTQFVQEGSSLTFTAHNLGGNGGVTFSLDPGSPAGATIDPATGVFRWTPPDAQAVYNVPIRATDATGATDSRNVTVMVFDVPPNVQAGVNADATTGAGWSRAGYFTDPNPDTWVATVDYGDGSGVHPLALNPDKTFTLNHTYNTPSLYVVAVTINDSQGGQGRGFFAVTVTPLGAGGAHPSPAPTPATPATPATPGTPAPFPPVVQLTPAQARAQARADARAARQARIAAARAARFARFHHFFTGH